MPGLISMPDIVHLLDGKHDKESEVAEMPKPRQIQELLIAGGCADRADGR